jgi:hypothetical protein
LSKSTYLSLFSHYNVYSKRFLKLKLPDLRYPNTLGIWRAFGYSTFPTISSLVSSRHPLGI